MVDYSRYSELFESFGIQNMDVLSLAWNESHRYYHNEDHLASLLHKIDQSAYTIEEKNILNMVAFFHDIVYLPLKNDNEEQSVAFFIKHSQDHPDREQICQMILDTKHHEGKTALSKAFCAMDMAIVSESSFRELWEWERKIFKEYQALDYTVYQKGRVQLLETFKKQFPQNSQNIDALIGYLHSFRPKVGIYPGSFNPFHNGHLNILEKAEKIFDKVIIATGINPEKDKISKGNQDLNHLLYHRQVETFSGLLTDFISTKEKDVDATLIRGLRNGDDLAYEMNQLTFIKDLKPDLKTIFLHCDREFEHISSSALRNLEKVGKGLSSKYIP